MAKFDGKNLRGAVGAVVFRVVNGVQIISAKPTEVRQTEETKRAASTFGEGSSLSCQIRDDFRDGIIKLFDPNIHDRLLSILNMIFNRSRDRETLKYFFDENSFSSLLNFDFNINSPLKKQLPSETKTVVENQRLTIAFPNGEKVAKLKFIKDSWKCEIKVHVRFYRLKEGLKTMKNMEQTLEIMKYEDNDLRAKEFVFPVPAGCLCVVSMFLHYHGYPGIINTKKMNPGAICYAGETPGIFEENESFLWSPMRKIFD